MKVVCDRGALLDAINLISGVVAARTPRPQLTCVKLTAAKSGSAGTLTLAATDTEVSLTLQLDSVDVQEPGQALVPADKLAQIVRAEDTEKTLAIEAKGDTTHITGTGAHFQLRGFMPDEFVEVPGFAAFGPKSKAGTVFQHQAASLEELIRRTLFAAARENSRYAINGVLMKRDGKKIEFVATDGRRLALSRATTDEAGEATSCIIPSKALTMVAKLIDDAEESVAVSIHDNQVLFGFGIEGDGKTGRAVLTSNLVEGSFPPYEDVIPKDQTIRAGFDRDALASAVRKAALLTNEESRGVRMAFNAADKTLELSSRVPEMGEARIEVEVKSFEGEDIEIGFNPQFVTDALKVIDEAEVTIELKAANKPGLLRSGQDFVYVVMPVTLQ